MILSRRTVGVALAALATAGCGDGDADSVDAGGDRPYVMATTSIWADIVGRVACDGSIGVRTLIPPGIDAHAYEPSLRDREALDEAALVVANGLGLEELLADTLEEVGAGGVAMFEATDHLEPLAGPAGGADPHVWFDPLRVAEVLPALGDALVDAGADRAAIDRCVATARTDLAGLDEELAATLSVVAPADRLLVTNHDALGYFADRYDFQILGTVLPSASTLTEASPAELAALADAIDAAGVPAIFTESLHTSGDADALAARLGIEVVELYTDALGPDDSGAETYAGLLRTDATRIADALGR